MEVSKPKYELLLNIKGTSDIGILAQAIFRCFENSFGVAMPEDEMKDAIVGDLVVVVKNDEGDVIGFGSLRRKPLRKLKHAKFEGDPDSIGFYLGAGTVDMKYQNQGIYRMINRFRLERAVLERGEFLSTTTQNPRVEKGVCKILDEIVKEKRIRSYEVERQKIAGFYGRRLTAGYC
jgi:hypothetical protein